MDKMWCIHIMEILFNNENKWTKGTLFLYDESSSITLSGKIER